ncbi:MAG: hypothetical protein AAGC77_14885, partial [Pseudomonadota bacterium]
MLARAQLKRRRAHDPIGCILAQKSRKLSARTLAGVAVGGEAASASPEKLAKGAAQRLTRFIPQGRRPGLRPIFIHQGATELTTLCARHHIGLVNFLYFDNYENMETKEATEAFSALSQPSRLLVVKRLV